MTLARGFAFCLLAFTSSPPLVAQDLQAPEWRVKAAFLYNFTKLVDWPTNAFASTNAPLVIGVLGKDPFGTELDEVLAGRKAQGRNIQTARYASVNEALHCQILFISASERHRLNSIFDALQNRPILTVGDTDGFVARGMIGLVKADDTINLRINLQAAHQAGLQLSSRLTRLDTTLRPSTSPPPAPPGAKQ